MSIFANNELWLGCGARARAAASREQAKYTVVCLCFRWVRNGEMGSSRHNNTHWLYGRDQPPAAGGFIVKSQAEKENAVKDRKNPDDQRRKAVDDVVHSEEEPYRHLH